MGRSVVSVDDTLKIIACREQHKKLTALEMELTAARQEGFTSGRSAEINGTDYKIRPLVVIGIFTTFGRKNNRDAIRQAWMGTGGILKKMENEKGIIARFVIGRSANRGDSLDQAIDNENRKTKDFIILDTHVESPEEFPKKSKLFFAHAAEKWNAEFYSKVNDDVYVNIDALGATLATHLDKPRVYMGCMKSGEVFSQPSQKWYEPEWWKFGDKKSYFRHASAEMYVISQALAKFVSINRAMTELWWIDSAEIYSVPMPTTISVSDLGLSVLMLNMSMIPSFVAPRGQEVSFSPSLTYSHTRTHARRPSHENYEASSISFEYLPRDVLLTYISALTGAICAGV
ncbi:hypothetical protein C1H46_032932 [Malus baccata]|uniref:Hexosyltransferase n=1 Tax=Malus baccata TaxID=106549 RepID=A0A540L577_MALBA|nr:hypothetical protein C1H46_032932 [Malus baccata]